MKKLILLSILLLACFYIKAQTQKTIDTSLFRIIYQQDSLLFGAFNDRKLDIMMSFFDKELEFYHDKTGLTSWDYNKKAMGSVFVNAPDITRELLKETMEVYAIPNYGAVQIARHRFCHTENGKMDCGVFKFIHVWKNTEAGWRITRIISVDH
jgi:hypothetical protein